MMQGGDHRQMHRISSLRILFLDRGDLDGYDRRHKGVDRRVEDDSVLEHFRRPVECEASPVLPEVVGIDRKESHAQQRESGDKKVPDRLIQELPPFALSTERYFYKPI